MCSSLADNWAFLFAQKLALKNEIPLHVCFCLKPKFLDATIRHYKFLLKGNILVIHRAYLSNLACNVIIK